MIVTMRMMNCIEILDNGSDDENDEFYRDS